MPLSLPRRYLRGPSAQGIGTAQYPRLVPKDAECAAKLVKGVDALSLKKTAVPAAGMPT